MFDCSKELRAFHDDEILLPQSQRDILRGNRDASQERLKAGLEKDEKPKPVAFVKQGSYAMHTMVQHPDNDYDIDDGVVFNKEDLIGAQGADMAALDARKMVLAAVTSDVFKQPPELKTNCVRIYYNEGYHIDIPVYRQKDETDEGYELASSDWKKSNPEGVTKWFQDCLKKKKSGKEPEGEHQMRRMVCLLKAFSSHRTSWNMPSGFALTILVNECYSAYNLREDEAFYNLLTALHLRLGITYVVRHPVLSENLTETASDPDMKELRERIEWALAKLKITNDPKCDTPQALKAWGEVFNTKYFDSDKIRAFANESLDIFGSVPSSPVVKNGGGRYG